MAFTIHYPLKCIGSFNVKSGVLREYNFLSFISWGKDHLQIFALPRVINNAIFALPRVIK